jgi:molybdopterin converting factor subunit 1
MDMREMNRIKILFFATLRERAGVKSLELDVSPDMTVEGLKEKLIADYPNLKESMHAVLITVNREYAFEEAVIPPNAEIGLFPPVSGG